MIICMILKLSLFFWIHYWKMKLTLSFCIIAILCLQQYLLFFLNQKTMSYFSDSESKAPVLGPLNKEPIKPKELHVVCDTMLQVLTFFLMYKYFFKKHRFLHKDILITKSFICVFRLSYKNSNKFSINLAVEVI